MRVQHNIASMNSYRNYNNNTSAINKNLEKLSSGYKINRAGDDAAGLAISEKMRAQITGLEGAQKNAKDGISLIQTAEGALTEVHSMLNRMYSLAEQSANGTYTGTDNAAEGEAITDRGQLQKEVEALRTEIDRIADSTNFNGITLLGGKYKEADNALKLQIGDTGDEYNQMKVQIASVKTGEDGLAISEIDISTAEGGNKALKTIQAAIQKVSDNRGQLGAYQNRLEHTINNLSVTQENMQDAESTIRDTDVADEMMKYTKNSILVQSAQAMLAQANQQPQGVLQLLQ